jgi:DNA-binding transcriptional ArsR family regulator
MVNELQNSIDVAAKLDGVFSALGDASRRSIVERLMAGEATVGTVSEPLALSKPAVTKHLKVLEGAGLIERRVDGREHWLRLAPEGFRSAAEWFTHYQQFWSGSLDRLAALVADLEEMEIE